MVFLNVWKKKSEVPPSWRLLSVALTDADHVNTVVAEPKTLPSNSFGVYTFIRTSGL